MVNLSWKIPIKNKDDDAQQKSPKNVNEYVWLSEKDGCLSAQKRFLTISQQTSKVALNLREIHLSNILRLSQGKAPREFAKLFSGGYDERILEPKVLKQQREVGFLTARERPSVSSFAQL